MNQQNVTIIVGLISIILLYGLVSYLYIVPYLPMSSKDKIQQNNSDLGALSATVAGHTASIGTLNTTVTGHTTSIGTLNTTVAGHTTSIATNATAITTLATEVETPLATITGSGITKVAGGFYTSGANINWSVRRTEKGRAMSVTITVASGVVAALGALTIQTWNSFGGTFPTPFQSPGMLVGRATFNGGSQDVIFIIDTFPTFGARAIMADGTGTNMAAGIPASIAGVTLSSWSVSYVSYRA